MNKEWRGEVSGVEKLWTANAELEGAAVHGSTLLPGPGLGGVPLHKEAAVARHCGGGGGVGRV